MNFLSNLLGNLTSTILRLALVAGTLALVYLFAIKPVLDTTNNALEQSGLGNLEQTVNQSIEQANAQTERAMRQSLRQTRRPGGAAPQQLLRCVRRANNDTRKMHACARRFARAQAARRPK